MPSAISVQCTHQLRYEATVMSKTKTRDLKTLKGPLIKRQANGNEKTKSLLPG